MCETALRPISFFLPDWLSVLGPGDGFLEPEQREVVDELGELVVGVLDQLGDADLEVLIWNIILFKNKCLGNARVSRLPPVRARPT